jgi:hypothetical protein
MRDDRLEDVSRKRIVRSPPRLAPDSNRRQLETSGEGYAVWVRKSKKAETKAAVDAPKPPLTAPGE